MNESFSTDCSKDAELFQDLRLHISNLVLLRKAFILHDPRSAQDVCRQPIQSLVGAARVASTSLDAFDYDGHMGYVLGVLVFEKSLPRRFTL